MGMVSFSIDLALVECLKTVLPLGVFVETGTFTGDTVAKVLTLFDVVHSVELSEVHHREAIRRFSDQSNVRLVHGDSSAFVRQLQSTLGGQSVLYWLDAHWCVAADTSGEKSQCPLIHELEAIGSLREDSVILIDDARLFLCAPPPPHEVSQWPTFQEILTGLRTLSSTHQVTVCNDVIIFHPVAVTAAIKQFAFDHGIDWLVMMHESRRTPELRQQVASLEVESHRLRHELHRLEVESSRVEDESRRVEVESRRVEVESRRLGVELHRLEVERGTASQLVGRLEDLVGREPQPASCDQILPRLERVVGRVARMPRLRLKMKRMAGALLLRVQSLLQELLSYRNGTGRVRRQPPQSS